MTQGELEKLAINEGKIFSDLESRIMADIVRKIKINGFSTASADWQITRLQQIGSTENEVRSWIQAALKASDEEIEHIFSDEVYKQYYGYERAYKVLGFEQIPYENNIVLQQLVDGVKKQISGEYQSLTQSMGFAIRNPSGKITYSPLLEYYRTTLDNAVMDIQSGSFSYQTVLERTVNQMTSSGLRWVDYDSGVHSRVDVAARRAVMAGFRKVQAHINRQVMNDLGTEYVEVSWHAGARPEHQKFQGRVFHWRK